MNVMSKFYVFTKITSFWHYSYLPLGVGANNFLLMSNDSSRDAYDGGRGAAGPPALFQCSILVFYVLD